MKCDVCGKEISEEESYKGCCKECDQTDYISIIESVKQRRAQSAYIDMIKKKDL